MNIIKSFFSLLIFFLLWSCNSKEQIISLLNSKEMDDIILGAKKAGESGNKEFVTLLLKNADDWRTSTRLSFKGVSVYKSKMEALKKILKKEPPVKITSIPDSTVIKFYSELFLKGKGK